MTGHSVEMLIPERRRSTFSATRRRLRIPGEHHVELDRDRAAARGASGGSGYYRTQTHGGPSANAGARGQSSDQECIERRPGHGKSDKANSFEEFRTQFRKPIQGLSASQDLLVKSAWKNVPLTELVRSQFTAGNAGTRSKLRRAFAKRGSIDPTDVSASFSIWSKSAIAWSSYQPIGDVTPGILRFAGAMSGERPTMVLNVVSLRCRTLDPALTVRGLRKQQHAPHRLAGFEVGLGTGSLGKWVGLADHRQQAVRH
jgi:hypothetical protein